MVFKYFSYHRTTAKAKLIRSYSTISEIFRCIKPTFGDLSTKEVLSVAFTLYNNAIHSSIKVKPREAFYGLKDNQERPMQIEKIIEKRDQLYDEIILENEKSKKQALEFHNRGRDVAPDLVVDKVAFNKVQGIRKKTKSRYSPITVAENKGRVIVDDSGREI